MLSVVVPVYRNADTLADLLQGLADLHAGALPELEVVFVVDGSPDDSYLRLAAALPAVPFPAQLLSLSRNFGSFAAIRAGMEAGRGERFAVIAADLQEPLDLLVRFEEALAAGHDVALGQRTARQDPLAGRLAAASFWWLYRRFIQPEVPAGGVDVFACTRRVRDLLLALRESNSSLVGLLLWVGFRRAVVPYARRPRAAGRSAWSFARRLRYMSDSIFSFSDLPIRMLSYLGVLGVLLSLVLTLTVVTMKLAGDIPVPGYAATLVTITFFAGLNSIGLGIIGGYIWRAFENSKGRPGYIVASCQRFGGAAAAGEGEPA